MAYKIVKLLSCCLDGKCKQLTKHGSGPQSGSYWARPNQDEDVTGETWSMPFVIRPARAEDLPRAEELVVRSINDLTERHGFGAMATLRPPQFQRFSLEDDPDGLWLAE